MHQLSLTLTSIFRVYEVAGLRHWPGADFSVGSRHDLGMVLLATDEPDCAPPRYAVALASCTRTRRCRVGLDVVADVVAESGDTVYEPGILKDVECMRCGLAGHAVVCAKAGDRGCCLAGRQLS